MNQAPKTMTSFFGLYYSWAYPASPSRQTNWNLNRIDDEHVIEGLNVINPKLAMKEIVQHVLTAEKSDGLIYCGFELHYQVDENPKAAKNIYFAKCATDVLSRRAALNLIAHCQNFPFNNWMSSYVRGQGEFIKNEMELSPADTLAFIRVKGLTHHLFPIRPEDSVVDKKTGRFYYPKLTRRGLTEAKK